MTLTRIGIRREDKNIWERRVPLTPADIQELAREHNLKFTIQPFERRTFRDQLYSDAGITVSEDLAECGIIMGVKEIPLELLEEGKTYVFFSHTIKGQSYNMPLLQRLLDLNITLIDYELIADADDRRLVFFGPHAGYAGMINSLSALGGRLQAEGIANPFERIRSAYTYDSLAAAQDVIRQTGREIIEHGLPAAVSPLVVGFTGYGNVSQGAQSILDLLPVREINPAQLLTGGWERADDAVLKVVFHEQHLVERLDGSEYELQTYYKQPELFRSLFSNYLPHLSMMINAVYWDKRYPRLVTKEYLRSAWPAGELKKFKVIGDISIDIAGSVECSYKATHSDNPCYVYEPKQDRFRDGVVGDGPVIMAVDNLPCEIHRESSEDFSRALKPFLPAMAAADWNLPLEDMELPEPIKKAIITHQGRLAPAWEQLRGFLPGK